MAHGSALIDHDLLSNLIVGPH